MKPAYLIDADCRILANSFLSGMELATDEDRLQLARDIERVCVDYRDGVLMRVRPETLLS